MLTKPGDSIQYLLDLKEGKLKPGLGIDCLLDNFLRFKCKQVNIILGHDNVGKTYWINWYFLCLALKHKLKFCLWCGENQKGQILRDLIQLYSGEPFKKLTNNQIQSYLAYLEQFFIFVDNAKLYKPLELLEIFKQSECNVALIDPFTGLDREMTYEGNYAFMNKAREFVNQTGITIYINTHPNTESGRTGHLYPDGEWKGHLKPPLKDHIEGGKAFLNRCDDMLVIHRLIKHKEMKYKTMVGIEKIKDTETGGKITGIGEQLLFNWNSGLGFEIYGVNPLREMRNPKKTNLPF
jgi:hypothetical protein